MTRPPASSATHRREHRSLLASVERRGLIWIARRLPDCINPDHLSALGLVAMALAGLAFAAFKIIPLAGVVVVFCLAANWFGDSLDGTLARVRRQERPRYGFYVDHVIDLAAVSLLMGGLACSGLMNPILALILLAAYLAVSAEAYLATHAAGVFRLSFLGFGPTELRMLVAAGALKAMDTPRVSIGPLGSIRLFDVGALVGSIGLLIVFLVSVVRTGRDLYIAEPVPAHAGEKTAA